MFLEQRLQLDDRILSLGVGPASGPPLLLLHGVLRRWRDFAAVLPMLSTGWHVHGLDFRGHGGSSWTPGQYRAIDYLHDALAVLDRCLDQPAVLFGHSLGAMVATAAAATRPDRVRALVLEDPPFATMGKNLYDDVLASLFRGFQANLTPRGTVAELARRLAEIQLVSARSPEAVRLGDLRDAAALRFSAACLNKIDPEVLEPIVAGQWLDGYDLASFLPAIRCPVLLLRGDPRAGGMLTKEDATLFEQTVPDCCSIYFPRVGHLIHASATESLAAVLLPFLESVRD